MTYHIAKNGVQLGTMTDTDVAMRLQSGELTVTDLCWTEGMAEWQPIGHRIQSQQPLANTTPAVADINPYAPPAANLIRPGMKAHASYAGFWWRFLAAFVDGIIMNIAGAVVGGLLGFGMGAAGITDEFTLTVAGGFIGIVVNWIYEAYMISSAYQATLGKMLCGITVTDLEGNRVSFGRATGRYFGKFVSTLILLIGYLMCLFDDRKQCLHDKMAGTIVCR